MSAEERLQAKLMPEGECLIFIGATAGAGYGRLYREGGGKIYAHRLAWLLAGRPLAKHKEIHHRCEVKRCCNVEHMRVTMKGKHTSEFHRRVRCRKGHRMKGRNVIVIRRSDGSVQRFCRVCHNARQRAYARRHKQQAS